MIGPSRVTDEQLEQLLGNLLRAGVLTSAAVVLAGGVVYLLQHGAGAPGHHVFRGEPAELRHLGGIVRGALTGRGPALIQLGLVLLLATPLLRVVSSLAGFALQRDRVYVVVTLIVLAILLYGLLGGRV
jgi:uncharacterized membrane protein